MSSPGVRRRLGLLVALWVGVAVALPVVSGQTTKPTKPPKLDVPYVPTNQKAVEAMLELTKVTSEDYVIDLGCGDGRIVITAAKKYKARGFGVDLDPQRVRESKQNAAKAGVTDRVKFEQADIMVTDIRKATVVTLFLLESVNLRLRPKLFADLKPGTRVVSNTFTMSDWKEDKKLTHAKAYGNVIYFWVMPAPVGGTWKWKTKTAGQAVANSLKLTQKFQAVRGAVSFPGAAGVPIAGASLSGTQIRFTAKPRVGGKDVEVAYQGTVDGDTIRGTQKWPAGSSGGNGPWVATRDRVDVTGQWQISAPQETRGNGTLRIQRKGGKYVATFIRGRRSKTERPLPAFYVWGTSIRFEVGARGGRLIFHGSLTADAGEGTVGGRRSTKETPWSAKRVGK